MAKTIPPSDIAALNLPETTPPPDWEGLRIALLQDEDYQLIAETAEPIWTLRLETLATVGSDFWPGIIQNWNKMVLSSPHSPDAEAVTRWNGLLEQFHFPLRVLADGSLTVS